MAEENAGLYYPDGSYRDRREIIRASFLATTHYPPQFETPLPQQQDFDYWSTRMQRRQSEALSTEEERQHVRIGLEHRSLVSFIGDIHAGNAHTDYARVEAEVKAICQTPNSYAVLMGDLIDNFFWSPPIHEADSPVPDQIEYAWSIINRLAEKKRLLAGWTGNHDDTWGKKGGNTMYKRFSRDTGAYLMSGLGFCDIQIGEQEYKIAGAHQLLGFSMWNPNHPQQRAGRTGGAWGADLIVSAHCFDEETEILTKDGWRRGIDIQTGDIVGTVNKLTGAFEWNANTAKYEYGDFKELVRFKSRALDVAVTGEHGMLKFNTSCDALVECTASEMLMMDKIRIPVGAFSYTGRDATDLHRLLIWIVADGSIRENKTSVRFHLKKQRKVKRLVGLLDKMGLEYRYMMGVDGAVNIYITNIGEIIAQYFPGGKRLGDWVFNFDRDLVYTEYSHTDGCVASKNSIQISTAKKSEVDLLQAYFAMVGYRTVSNKRPNCWTVYVNRKQWVMTYIRKNKTGYKEGYSGRVWCVTVPNGTLITRRGGKVVLTQNTHSKGIQTVPIQEYGLKSRRVHYINVGTYKWTDGFIKDKGFGDKAKNGEPSEMLYGCSVILDRDTKTILPQWDILEAHKLYIATQEP